MLDKIKVRVGGWATIFLLIGLVVSLALWTVCSLWWLITNNMIDRTIFILISLGVTKLITLYILISYNFTEKNKNTLSI